MGLRGLRQGIGLINIDFYNPVADHIDQAFGTFNQSFPRCSMRGQGRARDIQGTLGGEDIGIEGFNFAAGIAEGSQDPKGTERIQ